MNKKKKRMNKKKKHKNNNKKKQKNLRLKKTFQKELKKLKELREIREIREKVLKKAFHTKKTAGYMCLYPVDLGSVVTTMENLFSSK